MTAALLLAGLFVGCRKDKFENLARPDEPALWRVSDTEFDQARNSLKTTQEINFFDFGFAARNNPNVIPKSKERDDNEDVLKALCVELIQRNQQDNFANQLLSQVGYPLWDRSLFLANERQDSSPVVILPFAHLTADSTQAYLLATPIDTSWFLQLTTKSEVDSMLALPAVSDQNLEFKILVFIVLDEAIFGHAAERYTEVFAGGNLHSNSAKDRCDGYLLYVTVCNCPQVFTGGGTDDRSPCCRTYIDCIESGSGGGWWAGGGSGLGGNGGGNGGGGGGSGNGGGVSPGFYQFWQDCIVMGEPDQPQVLTGADATTCGKLMQLNDLGLFSLEQMETLRNNTGLLNAAVQYLAQRPGDPLAQQIASMIVDAVRTGQITGAQGQQLLQLAGQLSLTPGQVGWLIYNIDAMAVVRSFLTAHPNNSAATAIANTVIQRQLGFITVDDLELLFDYPGIYSDYVQYLTQNPNANPENKMTALRTVVLAPNNPIPNLAERLNCFNITSNSNFTHQVTLYVDQPVANDDASSSSKEKAGHTWITLEQDQGGGNITRLSVGLYPEDFASPCDQVDGGAYNNDEGHTFDVSVTWPISDWGFNILVNDLKSQPYAPLYDLSDNNCSTWAVGKLNQLGFNIPATNVVSLSSPPAPPACHVEGLAPGQLGQDLRNNYQLSNGATRNTTGGNGPTSTCQ